MNSCMFSGQIAFCFVSKVTFIGLWRHALRLGWAFIITPQLNSCINKWALDGRVSVEIMNCNMTSKFYKTVNSHFNRVQTYVCTYLRPMHINTVTINIINPILGFLGPCNFARCLAKWWFQIYFCSSLFGEDSHFDQYFSKGLKPPTT